MSGLLCSSAQLKSHTLKFLTKGLTLANSASGLFTCLVKRLVHVECDYCCCLQLSFLLFHVCMPSMVISMPSVTVACT